MFKALFYDDVWCFSYFLMSQIVMKIRCKMCWKHASRWRFAINKMAAIWFIKMLKNYLKVIEEFHASIKKSIKSCENLNFHSILISSNTFNHHDDKILSLHKKASQGIFLNELKSHNEWRKFSFQQRLTISDCVSPITLYRVEEKLGLALDFDTA